MISEVFAHAATLIRQDGWTTGVERDSGGRWCLVGAVGGARFDLMTREEHRGFIQRQGLAHHDQARKTPLAELLDCDEETQHAIAVLYTTHYAMMTGQGTPDILLGSVPALVRATSALARWNDHHTSRDGVLELLDRAALLAVDIEEGAGLPVRVHVSGMIARQPGPPPAPVWVAVNSGWPTDADLKEFVGELAVTS